MTRYKKDLPLIVLQIIEPIINEQSALFKINDSEDDLLKIEDADPRSTFYFKVVSYAEQGQRLNIEFKPMGSSNVDIHRSAVDLQNLKGYFSNWKSYLQAYENIKIFDDPILKQYQKEFEDEIQIVDDDADQTTYNLNTQIWLDEYLTRYNDKLETIRTPENATRINEIQTDLIELKKTQTQLTKKKIIERLSRIWARTRKIGIGLLKDVYQEVKSELINRLITGRLDDLIK